VRKPPEPSFPLPVRIWRGLKDPIGYLTYAEAELGDVVALRQGRSYALFHPDHIKHVLQENAKNYEKGVKYRAALAPIMGNGLFTSEGGFWLRQRRLAQSAFQRAHVASFADGITACLKDLLEDWTRRSSRGETIDIRRDLVLATLRMTVRNLFSTEPDMTTLAPAVVEVSEQIHFGAQFLPFHLPKWVQTPARRRFADGMRVIDAFAYRVVADRRTAAPGNRDFVSLMMDARDEETGEGMSDRQLRDELVTMLIAGHDTVTDAAVWTMVLLAQHPEYAAQVREEIRRVAGDGWPSVESLKELDLLGRVIHESLRLYPPGWVFARTALADDEIGGYRIPAGAIVAMSPYVMQRSKRYWDDPLRFDPDRFLPERSTGRPRFVYFPFGGGQRQCIGQGLAMIELPLLLVGILRNFEFEIDDAASIAPSPRISLRPDRTVRARLRPPRTSQARSTA